MDPFQYHEATNKYSTLWTRIQYVFNAFRAIASVILMTTGGLFASASLIVSHIRVVLCLK